MGGTGLRRIELADATLEVEIRGFGEPVVLVQTALVADELRPVAIQPELRDNHTVVLYHRRGYAGSSPVEGPGSIDRDADDCRQLLAGLGIRRAHVVGLSYSAAVALQLAADTSVAHSLCLIEQPPVHPASPRRPGAGEFRAAIDDHVEAYRRTGGAVALDRFMSGLMGSTWRADLEAHLPGGVAQAERDADTFFATDLPALRAWRFGADDARRITAPTLSLGGAESGPWFAEGREVIRHWLPQTQDVILLGADHSLAMTHAPKVATAIAEFLRRHPLAG